MRFLLPLALALAACSSDPTDQNPPPPQDVQATDIGVDATDTGVDRLVVDVSDDRPAPIDNGPADAGVDVSFHSDPIPLADLGFDLGADAGGDAAGDVAGDQLGDAAADAARDVPADARIVCTNDDVRCTTNEECQAACLPGAPGSNIAGWCCPGRHHCIPTTNSTGCGPYINP